MKRVSISALGLTRSRLAPVALALALAGAGTLVDAARPAAAAHSTVTSVQGSAFGYHADDIALFGGAQPDTGPTPTVALASDASNSPVAATAATGSVQYGPAILFDSGQIDAASSGSLGPGGSVTSSTALEDVNASDFFTADLIVSSCTASPSGTSASTTVTNGTVRTHQGAEDHDEGVVAIPATPAPNYTVEGHSHVGGSGDTYRIVFNEQSTAGSSLTVNAVHVYYLGPTLTGELIIGQAVCGVTTEPGPQPHEFQPDGRIRRGWGDWVGGNIYNTTGVGQTRWGDAKPGHWRMFRIQVQNDGDTRDKFAIDADGAAVNGYRVKFMKRTDDITQRVNQGTFQTRWLDPGERATIEAWVKVQAGAAVGSQVSRLVTLSSLADPTKVDAVKFRVSRR